MDLWYWRYHWGQVWWVNIGRNINWYQSICQINIWLQCLRYTTSIGTGIFPISWAFTRARVFPQQPINPIFLYIFYLIVVQNIFFEKLINLRGKVNKPSVVFDGALTIYQRSVPAVPSICIGLRSDPNTWNTLQVTLAITSIWRPLYVHVWITVWYIIRTPRSVAKPGKPTWFPHREKLLYRARQWLLIYNKSQQRLRQDLRHIKWRPRLETPPCDRVFRLV